MRAFHHSLLLAAAWLCVLPASAETLLVVRKTDNAVDFMDPGLGIAPGVSADRKRATRDQRVARRQARGGVELRHARTTRLDAQHRRSRTAAGDQAHRPGSAHPTARRGVVRSRSDCRNHRRFAAPAHPRSRGRPGHRRDRDGAGDLAHGRRERRCASRIRHQHRLGHDDGDRPRQQAQARGHCHRRGLRGARAHAGRP